MSNRKTKIIGTIGPSSSNPKILKALIEAGLNMARLNFAHGTYAEKRKQIQDIRNISKELDIPVSIIADLQGPKMRLGILDEAKTIKKGDVIFLSANPKQIHEIPVQTDLTPYIRKDERVYINDGTVEFIILEIEGKTVQLQAQNDGVISSRKGINIPDSVYHDISFTKKDEEDLEFALQEEVDFVALSFIQTIEDLKIARDLIKKHKSKTQIISKIEKKLAVENLEEIMKVTDLVMVARGDLGVETKAAHVPLIQQKIINLAKKHKKPVIVATHMLESMIYNPRPTRAEVSDVANAVFDHADAVMLSAETASGKYPIESVLMMNEIIVSIEENSDNEHFRRACCNNSGKK